MLIYRRYKSYGQYGQEEIEPIAEAIGPYDTEPEALAAAEEQVRRMVGQGYVVETYYAVQRPEDGLWDAVIEYIERRQAAPAAEEKSNLKWILGGIVASMGIGAIVWGLTR